MTQPPLTVAVDARILDTPGQERVGVGRYALEITRALCRAKPDWRWLILTNRAGLFNGIATRSTRWPTARSAGRVAWLHAGSWADRAAASADVWFGTAFTLPAWWRGPAVVTIHDLMFLLSRDSYSSALRARYATAATRVAAKRSSYVVCGSQETRQRLNQIWGTDPAKVLVSPYGVTDAFGPTGETAVVAPEPYVLHVGTIEPRKRVDTVHAALRRVNAAGGGVSLVLAGRRGWGVDDLLTELDADPAVTFVVEPSDLELAALYRGATATVYASAMEGFGLPVAEAMACGSPVVASELDCIREFAGDAPLYAAPGDEHRIAEHIMRLIDSSAERERRRANGLEAASALRWETAAERTATAIEAAAARTGGA